MRQLILIVIGMMVSGVIFSQEIGSKNAYIEEYDSNGVLIDQYHKSGDWTVFVVEDLGWIGYRDNNDTTYTTYLIDYDYSFIGADNELIYSTDEGPVSFFEGEVIFEYFDIETNTISIITYKE